MNEFPAQGTNFTSKTFKFQQLIKYHHEFINHENDDDNNNAKEQNRKR